MTYYKDALQPQTDLSEHAPGYSQKVLENTTPYFTEEQARSASYKLGDMNDLVSNVADIVSSKLLESQGKKYKPEELKQMFPDSKVDIKYDTTVGEYTRLTKRSEELSQLSRINEYSNQGTTQQFMKGMSELAGGTSTLDLAISMGVGSAVATFFPKASVFAKSSPKLYSLVSNVAENMVSEPVNAYAQHLNNEKYDYMVDPTRNILMGAVGGTALEIGAKYTVAPLLNKTLGPLVNYGFNKLDPETQTKLGDASNFLNRPVGEIYNEYKYGKPVDPTAARAANEATVEALKAKHAKPDETTGKDTPPRKPEETEQEMERREALEEKLLIKQEKAKKKQEKETLVKLRGVEKKLENLKKEFPPEFTVREEPDFQEYNIRGQVIESPEVGGKNLIVDTQHKEKAYFGDGEHFDKGIMSEDLGPGLYSTVDPDLIAKPYVKFYDLDGAIPDSLKESLKINLPDYAQRYADYGTLREMLRNAPSEERDMINYIARFHLEGINFLGYEFKFNDTKANVFWSPKEDVNIADINNKNYMDQFPPGALPDEKRLSPLFKTEVKLDPKPPMTFEEGNAKNFFDKLESDELDVEEFFIKHSLEADKQPDLSLVGRLNEIRRKSFGESIPNITKSDGTIRDIVYQEELVSPEIHKEIVEKMQSYKSDFLHTDELAVEVETAPKFQEPKLADYEAEIKEAHAVLDEYVNNKELTPEIVKKLKEDIKNDESNLKYLKQMIACGIK